MRNSPGPGAGMGIWLIWISLLRASHWMAFIVFGGSMVPIVRDCKIDPVNVLSLSRRSVVTSTPRTRAPLCRQSLAHHNYSEEISAFLTYSKQVASFHSVRWEDPRVRDYPNPGICRKPDSQTSAYSVQTSTTPQLPRTSLECVSSCPISYFLGIADSITCSCRYGLPVSLEVSQIVLRHAISTNRENCSLKFRGAGI